MTQKFKVEFHYTECGYIHEVEAESQEAANEKITEMMGEDGTEGIGKLPSFDITHREFDACKG